MRVLFVSFHNKFGFEVQPGIGVLSTVLKSKGHETRLQPYFYYGENIFRKAVDEFKPDMIGLSATHMAVEQVKRIAPFLKKIANVPITLGGVFPILDPMKALEIDGIDAVCVGDGLDGILEFIEGNHPATNFIYKGEIEAKKTKCWNNCALPLIDYDIFRESFRSIDKEPKKLDFWTSNTCEFGCSFCCNRRIRNLTGQKNKPKQSIDMIIEAIRNLVNTSQTRKIQFRDPLFVGPADYPWLKEFLPKYSRDIGLPYSANARADGITKDVADLLADTGCYLVKIGLESGSEEIRNKVLKKGVTDEQFRTACTQLRGVGIEFSLNAMLGVPYETDKTARQTMDFMSDLEPSKTFLHIYQPWPGLDIPEEIRKYIRYLRFPALNDTIVTGHKLDSKAEDYMLDADKAKEEYVLTPVLDQPDFPYKRALELQQKFQESGEDT